MKPYIPSKEEEEKLASINKRLFATELELNRFAQFGTFRGAQGWLVIDKDKTESLYLLLFRTQDKLKTLKFK